MEDAGWNLRNKANLRYHNVRAILARENLRRLEITLNSRTRQDIDRSA